MEKKNKNPGWIRSGCLRYVEKIRKTRSLQYVESGSLHNVEILQTHRNVEIKSLQYVEKVRLNMGEGRLISPLF